MNKQQSFHIDIDTYIDIYIHTHLSCEDRVNVSVILIITKPKVMRTSNLVEELHQLPATLRIWTTTLRFRLPREVPPTVLYPRCQPKLIQQLCKLPAAALMHKSVVRGEHSREGRRVDHLPSSS